MAFLGCMNHSAGLTLNPEKKNTQQNLSTFGRFRFRVSFVYTAPPGKETVGDTWRMVWLESSKVYKGTSLKPVTIKVYMGVSRNDGTPQIIHFDWVFHYKPSILGCPYFWKHPYARVMLGWTVVFVQFIK